MRKILFVIGIFVGLFLCSAQNKPLANDVNNRQKNLVNNIVHDSICGLIGNKPALLYTYGHYGYSWAALVRDADSVRVLRGKVNYSGNMSLTLPMKDNRFDITSFLAVNKALISWGFDTLSFVVKKMTPVKCESYTPIGETLFLIDSDGQVLLNANNIVAFSGADSIVINSKYNKLRLVMRLLAEPEIRKYIPDALIY